MNAILNVREKVYSDESISKKEFHTYSSYNQTFKPNEEIRITIQNQDLYVLPHESYLNFQEIISKIHRMDLQLIMFPFFFLNNCVAYFLDEIKYEINGCEIDKTRFVGMTTTLKKYISLDNLQSQNLLNSGWSSVDEISTGPHFNFSVPLKNLLGFAGIIKKFC